MLGDHWQATIDLGASTAEGFSTWRLGGRMSAQADRKRDHQEDQ
jgi:hypothetical protein